MQSRPSPNKSIRRPPGRPILTPDQLAASAQPRAGTGPTGTTSRSAVGHATDAVRGVLASHTGGSKEMVRQGMVRRPSIDEIRERTYKARASWWTVIFVDPVAARVVRFLSPYGWATPNRITGASFLLGVVAAGFFSQAARGWLLAGALMFYLSFMLDCVDGKIARLNNNGTIFGTWLDYVLDRIRVLLCSIGLFGGQFMVTRHW